MGRGVRYKMELYVILKYSFPVSYSDGVVIQINKFTIVDKYTDYHLSFFSG